MLRAANKIWGPGPKSEKLLPPSSNVFNSQKLPISIDHRQQLHGAGLYQAIRKVFSLHMATKATQFCTNIISGTMILAVQHPIYIILLILWVTIPQL